MSTASKVLVGLIIVAAIPLFVLSLLVLAAHNNWRGPAAKLEADVLREQKQGQEHLEGDDGIQELRPQLFKLTVGRGHVWRGVRQRPAAPNAQFVDVALPEAGTQQVAKEMILYAFEDARNPEGGLVGSKYLGEYRVADVAADGKGVRLQPVHPFLLPLALAYAAKENWALYENMPTDNYESFAGLDAQQLGALIPANAIADYRKHGNRGEPGDRPERIVDGMYQRMLRDYDTHFREIDRRRAVTVDAIASATNDIAQLTAATAEIQKNIASYETEKQNLIKERDLMVAERDQVQQYRDTLETRLANGRREIARLIDENRKLSEQLAAKQREIALQIDASAGTRQASRN